MAPLLALSSPLFPSITSKKLGPDLNSSTALCEERNRTSESILPIRADDSRLPGLHDGRFYLSLAEDSVEAIRHMPDRKM